MKSENAEIVNLNEIREFIYKTFGLNFNAKRDIDLERNIGLAARAFSFSSITNFTNWLFSTKLNKTELGILASYFTVGETYFFREKKSFDFLEQIYLPGLIYKRENKNKILRIWSAGCAGGEEAYSIAILIHRTIPNIKQWNITILASDINPVFLEKAENGIYTKWSFRNHPEWLIKKYFIEKGKNQFQVIPEIRNMVTFSTLNLADNSYPSEKTNTLGMDIIFCRNVLIYFSQDGNRQVTNRFYKSLNRGGILLVSPVEMSNLISPKFEKIQYAGFTIYQKGVKENNEEKINSISTTSDNIFDIQEKIPLVDNHLPNHLEIQKPVNGHNKTAEAEHLIPVVSDFKQALFLFESGLFELAENNLTELLATSDENKIEIQILLAKTKANLGKLDEALILCNIILQSNKTLENMHYLRASILLELNESDAAIKALKQALYLNQDFVLAHFLLGNIELKTRKNGDSKKHFKNALSVLAKMKDEEILHESDGLTVGRFKEIINAIKN